MQLQRQYELLQLEKLHADQKKLEEQLQAKFRQEDKDSSGLEDFSKNFDQDSEDPKQLASGNTATWQGLSQIVGTTTIIAVLVVTVTYTAFLTPPGGWSVPVSVECCSASKGFTEAAEITSAPYKAFLIFNSIALSASLASLTILLFWQSWYLVRIRRNHQPVDGNDSNPLMVAIGTRANISQSVPYISLAVWLLGGAILSVFAAGTAACFVLQQKSRRAKAASIILALIGPAIAGFGCLSVCLCRQLKETQIRAEAEVQKSNTQIKIA